MDHLDVGNADDEKDSSARRPKVKRPELAPTLLNIYSIHFLRLVLSKLKIQ